MVNMDFKRLLPPFLALAAVSASAQIQVDATGRTPAQVASDLETQARQYAKVTARLTSSARAARLRARGKARQIPFSMPVRIDVKHPPVATIHRAVANSLTLSFDTTGPRVFSASYKALLQSIVTTAQPTLNAVFGAPAAGGTVYVRNFDADIGDRDAVAGGYYTPNNGSGQAEIRFPVYNSNEAAAVNFIHTLLLAYQGAKPYTYDAFNEGIVRAAVMKVCRTPGALPGTLASDVVESVLQNSYDVGPTYDWNNQRALGGPTFIAPNLRAATLPGGGSVGGLYLLRYLMAGSAWFKVLTEYPGFIASFNQAYYAQPSLSNNPSGLVTLAQNILFNLGGANATVEGLPFAQWFKRQFILETKQSFGTKVLCEAIPVTSGLSGTDFGVFIVQANYFSTALDGSETLMSGTCYPIFWDYNFNRITPSIQDQRIDFSGAYGSVVPNFSDFYAGHPYRVTIDLPVLDELARVNVPAGGIATATSAENNLYGTVEGAPPITGTTYSVVASWPTGAPVSIPVVNGTFGFNIGDANFQKATSVQLKLFKTVGGVNTTLLTRQIDKSVGSLAADLVVHGESNFSAPFPSGLNLVGFPVDPFSSSAPEIFNVSPAQLQLARYNASKATYDQYPRLEPPVIGHGYYVRFPVAPGGFGSSFSVLGRSNQNFPISVALRPGWNIIANPLNESVPLNQVQIVHAGDNPDSFANQVGVTIGSDIFSLTRGAVDAASGLVETGSLNSVTTLDPGQGYLVRVLAPEGLTMTFFPGSPPIGPFVKAVTHGWGVRLELSDGTRSLPLHLGVVREAKNDVDWRYCSALAPSMGGLQAVATRGIRLFRDVRKDTGVLQRYLVHLEGLRVDKTYSVKFPVEKGLIRLMQLVDSGTVRTVGPTTNWEFRATSSTKDVELRISGVAL